MNSAELLLNETPLSTPPVWSIDLRADPPRYERARIECAGDRIRALHATEDQPTLYATPGLIDCHVHWIMPGGTSLPGLVDSIHTDPVAVHAWARANAMQSLRCGITSACDKGAPTRQTHAIYQSLEEERRTGTPLPRTFFSPYMLIAKRSFADPFCVRAETPDAVYEVARAIAAYGGRILKLIPEADYQEVPPHYPLTMSQDALVAARKAATDLGLLLALHAKGRESISAGICLRAESLEHVLEADADDLSALARQGGFFSLTLLGFAQRLAYATAHGQRLEIARSEWAQATRVARLAVELSQSGSGDDPLTCLLMGSDAGSFNTPHGSLDELYHLRASGIPAAAALRAATWNAARFLRSEQELGVLDPGYLADLVLWDQDPVGLDLAAWRDLQTHIVAVVASGRVVYQRGRGT